MEKIIVIVEEIPQEIKIVITGPLQGFQGIPGEQGIAGPIGPIGPQGEQGEDGNMGLTGEQGPIGPAGPQGIPGEVGAIGLQGPTGPIGNTGATGPQGPVGATGATGPKGDTGDAGSIDLVNVTIASNILSLNLDSKVERSFNVVSAIAAAFSITFSNVTNARVFSLDVLITGSVAITMPSGVVMQMDETSRWNNTTKVLTLAGDTASPFELSFTRIGSLYKLKASSKYFSS